MSHERVSVIEGVPYRRYRVYYTLADGRRCRMMRWSPGKPFVYDEVGQELVDRFGVDGIKPRSVTIEQWRAITLSENATAHRWSRCDVSGRPALDDARGRPALDDTWRQPIGPTRNHARGRTRNDAWGQAVRATGDALRERRRLTGDARDLAALSSRHRSSCFAHHDAIDNPGIAQRIERHLPANVLREGQLCRRAKQRVGDDVERCRSLSKHDSPYQIWTTNR